MTTPDEQLRIIRVNNTSMLNIDHVQRKSDIYPNNSADRQDKTAIYYDKYHDDIRSTELLM